MKIQSATLENQPGGVGDTVKCLRKASKTIPKQATDACWGDNAPACLFDHQNKSAMR
jgi:hypothetical protein